MGHHHVARRVLEDAEVLAFDLLTLGTFLTDVSQLGVLFGALDCLEALTACIRGLLRIQLQQLNPAFDDCVSDEGLVSV
ncbi:hypothetical protein SAMN05421858_3184 [Haladaptatus litoreus]|uniref:Uncharacterized protein n=1 Tax=Haladaptatus litoreus TaxID=553468 RepID=A0A1N7CQT8_9EURY|nr:hypothetical protein [Haladaptatus litoreus]SIR65952.1 hypothetical protein SAMN05421858_3184 [Haladaptatus litoreus]